jgi:hypothetical protein
MYNAYRASNRAISRLFANKPQRQKITHVKQANGATINIDVYIDQKNFNAWSCDSEFECMKRCHMLILATQAQFPRIELRSGKIIDPTEIGWSLFTSRCSNDECEEATNRLNIMACQQDRNIALLEGRKVEGSQ